MRLNRLAPLVVGALATLTCLAWLQGCGASTLCVEYRGSAPLLPSLLVGFAALGGALIAACIGATARNLVSASWARRHMRLTEPPEPLREAVERTGAQNVRCLDGDVVTAFCSGGLRPAVWVGTGLVRRLGKRELDAVLLHEEHHRRQRDPLRRAAFQAAADAAFFLPLLRWWAERCAVRSELAADRSAIRRLGQRPVAAALWALAPETGDLSGVPFDGAAAQRVAQLLGDHAPPSRPDRQVLASSGLGVLVAMALAACLGIGLVG